MADSTQPALIVSDIDGTLLPRTEVLSPETVMVLTEAHNQGIPVILATGRPLRWVEPVSSQLPFAPLLVCNNGALVADGSTGEILTSFPLSPETSHTIAHDFAQYFATAQQKGLVPEDTRLGFGVEGIPTALNNVQFYTNRDFSHAWQEETAVIEEDSELFNRDILKLIIRVPGVPSSTLFSLAQEVISPELAQLTYSYDDGFVEISAPGVTKRTGIEYLVEQRALDASSSMAFGDMPNDREMLTWASTGVAMGSAPQEVKAVADRITGTCEENGVSAVLSEWFHSHN